MAKILLIEKETWTTKSRQTGEQISGVSYIGILESGQVIKFTSKNDHDHAVKRGTLSFDPQAALDLDLRTKIFNNKVSYYEAQA